MLPFHPLLLFLLVLPPSLGCHIGSSTECRKAPFVPGHNLAGEGFDIVKMATTGASVVDVINYMVGGQEEGNCTLCTNTLLNQVQKLPVSVLDWRIKVLCRRSLSSKMYESSSSVLKESTSATSVSWKVGLSVGLGKIGRVGFAVGGTHSKSSKFAQSHSSQDKFSFTSHEFKCKYYTFRLHSRPPLAKEFEESLKNLPVTYSHKNNSAYKHFISIYGTHFIRRVQLGGRVQSTTAMRTCKVAMTGLSMHSVSNCLSAEATASIMGISSSAKTEWCKAQSKKLKTGMTFSNTFTDRVTEVMGGNGEAQDILFNPEKKSSYKDWLKSLKKQPGVVSYQLSSLHMLVPHDNPTLKNNLRDAIVAYILANAVSTSCPSSCKTGSRNKDCACKCSGHQNVDANCCPGQPGLATMTVTVARATGLWGDYFSKTDGYVKVFFGNQGGTTPVIWNNNFPVWNYVVRLGTINLSKRTPVRFEVWDRDNRWNDDLLGKAAIVPTKGTNMKRTFKLKHGSLYVSLSVVCAPSLKGNLCGQYAPSPGSQGRLSYLPPWAWDAHRPSLLQGANSDEERSTTDTVLRPR